MQKTLNDIYFSMHSSKVVKGYLNLKDVNLATSV